MEKRTDEILSFLKEIEKYKTIERKTYSSNPARKESDAEHSWHLAMFIILFEKELPANIDFKKMLKLALIHDLPEIYAGDTFAFDKEKQINKSERESLAAKELFSRLPDDLHKEFIELFEEYEHTETKESKIVKSLDKIQPILQNLCSDGKSWRENNIALSDVDNYKRKYMTHDKFILSLYEKLLAEAKNKNLF